MRTLFSTKVWAWIIGAGMVAGCASSSPSAGVDAADLPVTDASVPLIDAALPARRRVVILMIGDGMGRAQLDAASLYATGATGGLYMQGLPHRGQVRTASLSGITDSAAAATTMATGVKTLNGRIGMDAQGQPVETLVERARRAGLRTGIVTTTSLPHATPGSFSAHRPSRHDYVDIAGDQALVVQPDVMLGGGLRYFLPAGPDSDRDDAGLIEPLHAAGYDVVYTAAELAALEPSPGRKLFGGFAGDHLTYALERAPDSTEPTLAEMSLAAIRQLDATGTGFFLMIEGGRIDHAGHGNDLANNVGETLAFDEAIAAVHAWQQTSDADVTLVITADHECGGLTIRSPPARAGQLPDVMWRWGQHTNARVDVFGAGSGTADLDGQVIDHAAVHALLAARVDGAAVVAPPRVLTPDGSFGELRYRVAEQVVTSGFGAGFNQLDALHLDADATGLAIGVEGVFEWAANAVVVLIDVDYGAGTGVTSFGGALSDSDGRVDAIVSSLHADGSALAGFGADFALVSWGGTDPHVEDLIDDAGLRALVAPLSAPDDLSWHGAAINFGERVRTSGTAVTTVTGEGLEVLIPWPSLYQSGLPAGATLAIAVVLVNDDGGYASNQALPPFAPGTPNPGRSDFALPAVAVLPVDADGDGLVDATFSPVVIP